jgi:peptide/nickel transport system substrate-binding protein
MRGGTYDITHMASGMSGSANVARACRESIYKLCTGLAESWQANTDFTQWTFKVRDNVLWHDGTPFTAEDVKFWFQLAYFGVSSGGKTRLPAFYKANLGDLKTVEVLAGNRVRVTLASPAPQYLFGLSEPRQTFFHPKHLMQPLIDKGEVNVAPIDVGWVGTGPFKFHSYTKGSRAQVRRFEKYWEKDEKGRQMPYLDGIDFAVIRDPTAMDAAFRVGRLDGGARGEPYYLTPERKAAYERDLGDRVWFAQISQDVSGFNFNVLKPGPWQDVRVRKAVALWMDKQAYIKSVQSGLGTIGPYFLPTNPFTNPDFATWPGFSPTSKEKDRAEAKRLMAEAGYSKGFKMDFLAPRRWTNYAEFYQGQLLGLGIDLGLKLLDEPAYEAARLTLEHETQHGGTSGNPIIPEATELYLNVYSKTKVGRMKQEDPKIAEFFRRLNSTTSLEERVKIWRDMERYVVTEQFYYVPMAAPDSIIPYRSHVKGVVVPPERIPEYLDFATLWIDR